MCSTPIYYHEQLTLLLSPCFPPPQTKKCKQNGIALDYFLYQIHVSYNILTSRCFLAYLCVGLRPKSGGLVVRFTVDLIHVGDFRVLDRHQNTRAGGEHENTRANALFMNHYTVSSWSTMQRLSQQERGKGGSPRPCDPPIFCSKMLSILNSSSLHEAVLELITTCMVTVSTTTDRIITTPLKT